MHLAALLLALIACAAIIAIGSRFLLQPRQATLAFGVAADNIRALTEIKGVRDITSGVVPLVVWAAAGRRPHGARLGADRRGPHADGRRRDRAHQRREALYRAGHPRAHGWTARRGRPRPGTGVNDATDD
jgi:uncharacterized protein DUF4267